nr:MAG TPA: hypothetical protein [Caudoviricetes sp.]
MVADGSICYKPPKSEWDANLTHIFNHFINNLKKESTLKSQQSRPN